MLSIKEKIKGGLYGVAVGDALGATVEFMGRDEIQGRYGVLRDIMGGGWLNLRPGEWTDDTEMTLAVAEGIMADPDDPIPYIGNAFLRWKESSPPDIGSTTRAVFDAYRTLLVGDALQDKRDADIKERWFTAARVVHAKTGQTAGNGALMRTLPVGLAYVDTRQIFRQAMDIARMTHWDVRAGLTCAVYSVAVRNALQGNSEYCAIVEAARETKTLSEVDGLDGELSEIIGAQIHVDGSNLKPTGYTVDSFLCAVWAFVTSRGFDEAVIRAVNLGGDADTIGAIAGGLAGVCWGYAAIPERWIEKFTPEQRARLDRATEGLLKVRIGCHVKRELEREGGDW